MHAYIHTYIKTHGSESQAQEEATCVNIFKPAATTGSNLQVAKL